ncbi:hypothetical protein MESS2_580036 [Mesorhizobium metallidurans STM 2683]|uniref:Uncharacterized protein n=1 Tax=Mesorhizobium metallidurans STM 2683 TaxID=1297569 RepID=M5EUA7_9HYPH|nr:hypothetical protein MESS2_580036 [Mesorhizobium metallidurans STM 2683]
MANVAKMPLKGFDALEADLASNGKAAGPTNGPSCLFQTRIPSAPGVSGLFLPGKTD